jgi:hypothetical protein
MKLTIIRASLTIAILCLCGGAVTVFGQAITSSISGAVTDSSGAEVPGATVTVSDQSQGFTRETTTNSTGNYLVPGRCN